MQINSDKVEYLCGSSEIVEQMPEIQSLPPFSEKICVFFANLSQALLADKMARAYPDVITFAFFCRKASILKEKEKYGSSVEERIGRGVTFHIAPSNVPINFVYTMAAGLLSGNACIVRASSKPFVQTDIVCRAIRKVLEMEASGDMSQYIAIVRYEHDTEITQYYTSLCDTRIIWGGDRTISEIRNTQLNPRSFDVTFADRYSFCVIHSKNLLQKVDCDKLAADFYNDTYLYDQNACSAPRLMVWIGKQETTEQAKKKFWDALYRYAKPRYAVEPVIAVDKLMAVCRCAIGLDHAQSEVMPDNLISRIQVKSLSLQLPDYRCVGGSFIEYNDENLESIPAIVTRKYQTMSYIGFNPKELRSWVISHGLSGIDRIVPVGKTADFTLIWDGYDLIRTLSRIVYAE